MTDVRNPGDLSRRACVGLGLAALGAAAGSQPILHVHYPQVEERPWQAYGYQMLAAALERSGEPHRLELMSRPMSARAAVLALERGELPVLDLGLTARTAGRFEMVWQPLDLGFSGVRLLLGKPEALERLRREPTLQGLRRLSIGQGPAWTDGRLLRKAGVRVEEAPFARLLPMLQAGRFDLCALGADEARRVLADHQQAAPDVGISDALALHLPFVRLFCLHRSQSRLQQALERGLQALVASGELRDLLARHSGLAAYLKGLRAVPPLLPLPDAQLPPAFHRIPRGRFHPSLRATLPAA